MTDVPFYNGYYTKYGKPLIVGYPGYPYIDISLNDVSSFWQQAGLSEDAVNYLKNGGMSEEQIDTLVSLITTEE